MAFEYVLVGSGRLWIAPLGTTVPTPDQIPSQASVLWRELGEFDGGVKAMWNQKTDKHRVDNYSGIIKATVSEEDTIYETKCAKLTLENLSSLTQQESVTQVPAAAGARGYKTMNIARQLGVVPEFAFIFDSTNSPYLPGELLRFIVPRAFVDGNQQFEFTKDKKTLLPCQFTAMWDTSQNVGRELGYAQAVNQAAL